METNFVFKLNLLQLILWCTGTCSCGKINLIFIVFGENRIFGHQAIAPVYDVAVEQMLTTYPSLGEGLTRYSLFNLSTAHLDGQQIVYRTLSQLYQILISLEKTSVTALFSSGIGVLEVSNKNVKRKKRIVNTVMIWYTWLLLTGLNQDVVHLGDFARGESQFLPSFQIDEFSIFS
jgi:hypothetical protein